jgi:hypothetical protein
LTRGPKPRDPIFDRETALLLRDRYLQGETYKVFAEEMGESVSRISHALEKHKVISRADTSEHYRVIMKRRQENGIRVGRKPKKKK